MHGNTAVCSASADAGGATPIVCDDGPKVGRYVKIQRAPGTNPGATALALCEVQLFGPARTETELLAFADVGAPPYEKSVGAAATGPYSVLKYEGDSTGACRGELAELEWYIKLFLSVHFADNLA